MPIFIGDVHGEWTKYNNLIKDIGKPTIQVGDFGIGLGPWPGQDMYDIELMRNGNHRFGRGNHDNPFLCKENSQYIPDGSLTDEGVYWIGGAMSSDSHNRISGRDWWPEEELTMDAFYNIMDDYEQKKPDILASHDCPDFLSSYLGVSINGNYKSRTRQALESIINIHAPKIHVFGHHHKTFDEIVNGVRYICVPILGVVEI